MSHLTLPSPGPNQNYITLSAFSGGFITLPEKSFVTPSDADTKRTVPSLAFLVSHPGLQEQNPIRLMFDMGLRSNASGYSDKQQVHLQNRIPYTLGSGIAEQLSKSGMISASDIDLVILSHVHYDHHGDPENFPNTNFIVGNGSCEILRNGLSGSGSHQHFQPDLLPVDRTFELPEAKDEDCVFRAPLNEVTVESRWSPIGPFPSALDIFNDGSVYIVDSPGHLPGHINLLCRLGPSSWVYLGGDSCHDTRLLTGEKKISTWEDQEGTVFCIHLDKMAAEETLSRISRLKELSDCKVQIIMAHDWEWYEKNKDSCFPGNITF